MNKIKLILGASILLLASMQASAGIITGGDLLDQTGANQLENWLGLGDQDLASECVAKTTRGAES